MGRFGHGWSAKEGSGIFKCTQCGLCCCHIKGHPLYADLDDGSGVCKHYDAETKRCKIYAERPLHCNVDRFYEMFLRDKMTREEYYELNYAVCRRLQAEANR